MTEFLNAGRHEKGSLITVLSRGFGIMIAAVIGLGALFLILSQEVRGRLNVEPRSYALLAQEPLLRREEYSSVKPGNLLGKNGYFEVVDENARVLYCSGPAKNTYTEDALRYISDIDDNTVYDIQPFFTASHPTGYLLMQYQLEEGGSSGGSDLLTGISLFDADGSVIYSNVQLNQEKLTQKELNFLFQHSDNESASTVLQKHRFTTMGGSTRYLLIHSDSIYRTAVKVYQMVDVLFASLYVLAVVLTVVGTVIVIAGNVRRPLSQLQDAMDGFASGKREQVAEYQGPKEFVRVIETFNAMETKLEASEREQHLLQDQKRKMLADISHDLKTPITVIQGYVNAMQDGLIPQAEQRRYLDIITQKTRMLSELINQFSDLSRLEHPEYRPDLEEGDLSEYLREYIAGRYEELCLAGYRLEVDIPGRPIRTRFDHMQLRRVFENIIANSLKYTPSGSTIQVSLRREGSMAEIAFGDNGPGIPEEIREHIFEPFVTGNDARTSGKGTGLGMSIAKEIVEWHGGTIRVLRPENGETGTHYCITLPIMPDA